MPAKLLSIFALSSLAILFCSLAPSQTFALSIQANHHLARQLPHHNGIAKKKKKRDTCKPRPASSDPPSSSSLSSYSSSSSSSSSSPTPLPTDPPAQGGYNSPSPSSTTSSTSPPSTSPSNTPSTTPSGRGKLAIAWALGDDPRIALLIASPYVVMFHLWSATVPDAVKNSGLPVSIMLWGLDQDRINTFVQNAQPGYAQFAFGMNEVNEPTQAYTSVPDAVSAWYSYIKPLAAKGYTLGTPCTTSAPDGLVWMTNFLEACGPDCGANNMNTHWYDIHFSDFQAYQENWYEAFKIPIRVTEFACQNFNGGGQPSPSDIWSFTTQAIAWMDATEFILSYAPFGFMDDMYNVNPADCLFVPGNTQTLSALGWLYVNDGH